MRKLENQRLDLHYQKKEKNEDKSYKLKKDVKEQKSKLGAKDEVATLPSNPEDKESAIKIESATKQKNKRNE